MGDRMKLWNQVKDVNPAFTKNVNVPGKQPFTNIDTYYLIEMATGHFGSYGKEWGIAEMSWSQDSFGDTTILVLDATFKYPDGEFPISNSLKYTYRSKTNRMIVDEDCRKKLMTNTIGKALSYLGFGASVYQGKWEDSAYVQDLQNAEYRKAHKMKPATKKKLQELVLGTGTNMGKMLQFLGTQFGMEIESIDDMIEEEAKRAIAVLEEKLKRKKDGDN
jgi:hypothetical protein